MHKKGLVIGILILLLGVNIGSTFAGDVDVKTMSLVGFDGNTLYVGGSGPNNYTTIQSAIDNASDGDTVFVYDDSSPYYENIVIDKSIDLIGENKDSTVLQRPNTVNPNFVIKSSDVKISNFTCIGMVVFIEALYEFIHIYNMNFTAYRNRNMITLDGSNCTIENNIFNGPSNYIDEYGTSMVIRGNDNNIHHNTFSRKGIGLILSGAGTASGKASNNLIHNNTFYLFTGGVNPTLHSKGTLIINNNFIYCGYAILISGEVNIVSENNFIRNFFDGVFEDFLFSITCYFINNYYSNWKLIGNKILLGIHYLVYGNPLLFIRLDRSPSRTIFNNPISPELNYDSIIDMKKDITLFLEFIKLVYLTL